MSGGYPCFVDDFIEGRIFKNIEDAWNILYGGYGEMFQNEFSNAVIKKIVVKLI